LGYHLEIANNKRKRKASPRVLIWLMRGTRMAVMSVLTSRSETACGRIRYALPTGTGHADCSCRIMYCNIGIAFKKRIKVSFRSRPCRRPLLLMPVLLLLRGPQVTPDYDSHGDCARGVMAWAVSADPVARLGVLYWALAGEACASSYSDLQVMSVQDKPTRCTLEILDCCDHSRTTMSYLRD